MGLPLAGSAREQCMEYLSQGPHCSLSNRTLSDHQKCTRHEYTAGHAHLHRAPPAPNTAPCKYPLSKEAQALGRLLLGLHELPANITTSRDDYAGKIHVR